LAFLFSAQNCESPLGFQSPSQIWLQPERSLVNAICEVESSLLNYSVLHETRAFGPQKVHDHIPPSN
jgi:hypothetical protein